MRKLFMHVRKNMFKDRRGSLAIEIVIGCLVFLVVLCFLLDLITLGWRFFVISQTNNYVARTVGLQGGILASAPSGFPGGDAAYISISEMSSDVANKFNSAGIHSGDYTITLNGRALSSGVQVDYRDTINVEMKVKYKWDMVSNFIPGQLENWITSRRAVLSEFKYRYDSWTGE